MVLTSEASMDPCRGEISAAYRLASEALADFLLIHDGAVYGSWAILLQWPALRRTPQDLDIELVMPRARYEDVAAELASIPGVSVVRHEKVVFSPSEPGHTAKPLVGRALLELPRGRVSSAAWAVVGFKVVDVAQNPRVLFDLGWQQGGLQLPLLGLETCLAQKITRLSLPRSLGKRHTRWRDAADLYDILCASHACGVSTAALVSSIRCEWAVRGGGRAWTGLLPPPPEWSDHWDSAAFVEGIARPSPTQAVQDINAVLTAIMRPTIAGSTRPPRYT